MSLYYRGFVRTSESLLTVSIHYDDGGKIALAKSDQTAVILDTLPQEDDIQQGQRVIGYWPNRVRYYPGNIKGLLTEREVCTAKYQTEVF